MKTKSSHKLLTAFVAFLLVMTIPLGILNVFTMKDLVKGFSEGLRDAFMNPGMVDKGSCKTLKGEVVLVSVFLSDSESSWTKTEKDGMINNIGLAKGYLEKQAKVNNETLNIHYSESDLIVDLKIPTVIPKDINEYQWAYDLLHDQLDSKNLEKSLSAKYGAKNIGFLLHVNKNSVCYALPYSRGDDKDHYDECVVFYSKYGDGGENEISTYPHEILHLFGAIDLYPKEIAETAEKDFPNDIMLTLPEDLTTPKIDALTAYCIGWKESYDQKYASFFTADNTTYDDVDWNEKNIYKNQGSCKTLTGDILLVNIFLSDPKSSWKQSGMNDELSKIKQVKPFLEGQAKQYHQTLNIITGNSDLVYKVSFPKEIPTDYNDYEWTDELKNHFDFDKVSEELKNKYHTENIAYLFHVNKNGSSYSYSYSAYYSDEYFNEISIFYVKDSNGYTSYTSYYPYTILYMFGAVDLCFSEDKNETRANLAEKDFPNDIMLKNSDDLNEEEIGNFTAYCIGWKDTYDPKYDSFFENDDK